MSNDRSLKGFLTFLDYLGDKGLLNPSTAATRKASANKIFAILSDEEAQDVLALNLDEVMVRFHNLQGQNYSPGSIQTYQSRVKSSLEDFKSYIDNPLGFKPSVTSKERKPKATKSEKGTLAGYPSDKTEKTSPSQSQDTGFANASILPIPLRADLVVRIQGLPFDLTQVEANKLAAVIKAMAIGD
ncbi:MAG: hypothetical protein AAFR00_00160 [Pseudomonadota bacterium]